MSNTDARNFYSRSIPERTQFYLLQDIQRSGGIESARLSSIIRLRPDIYNSVEIKRLQNKIHYWRNLQPEKYCKLLEQFGITINKSSTEKQLSDIGNEEEGSKRRFKMTNFSSPMRFQSPKTPATEVSILSSGSYDAQLNISFITFLYI
jgi:hypothetical protein